MLNIHRAKFFTVAAIRAMRHMEIDNPKAFHSQVGGWLLTDLSYALESLGGALATKHPESATALDDAMRDDGNSKETKDEDEMHWPDGEHTLNLVQQLFGAVMPTSMFYTSWPAEYYDMIEVGYVLSKRMSPKAIKFALDAIYEKLDREKSEEQA
jgi:hypothetical protein